MLQKTGLTVCFMEVKMMRNRTHSWNQLAMRHSLLAAGIAAALALGGCASDGGLAFPTTTGSTGTPGGGSGGGTDGGVTTPVSPAAVVSPVAAVAQKAGNTTSSLGETVSALGAQVTEVLPAQLGTGLNQGVGGALVHAGQAVDALGTGVTTGLGQLGASKDPVGTTLGSLQGVVVHTGEAVSSLGQGVGAASGGVLAPLSPVTTPVGGLVNQVGVAVSNLGIQLGAQLDSGAVQQITRSVSTAVLPITDAVVQTTQGAGAALQVGQPVNNLLTQLGGAVDRLGTQITGDGRTPVAAQLGQVVSDAGITVAALGGVVYPVGGAGAGGGLLAPVSGLLGGLGGGSGIGVPAPVTGVLSGLTGGLTGGAGAGALAPVTGLVSSVTGGLAGGSGAGALAPVTGLVAGLTGGGAGGSGSVLAPVAGVVGGLTGGAAGANNLLTPVTNLVGGLLGGVKP